MVHESAFTVTRCNTLPKQVVMGEWVLLRRGFKIRGGVTIPGTVTALFSALTVSAGPQVLADLLCCCQCPVHNTVF